MNLISSVCGPVLSRPPFLGRIVVQVCNLHREASSQERFETWSCSAWTNVLV